jgi:imidazolonepropionase-like amidohydrolase
MTDQRLMIRAGRLIDGTGAEARADQTLWIEDGLIVRGGPALESDGAQTDNVLDLRGLTVLPGLIDAHVHLVFSAGENALADVLAEDDQRLLLRSVIAARQALAAGITTVRDLGGRGGVTFRLRAAIDDGILVGPRILAAGSPITITGGHCHFLGLEADGEPAVRAAARGQLKSGANCLKIMSTGGRMTPGTNIAVAQYSVAEIQAAVEEARRGGVSIAAHGLGTDGIRNAVLAGVDTIEHCNWIGADGSVAFDASVAARMAEQGTGVVATLTPLQRAPEPIQTGVVAATRRMHEMGVPFVAGTDAGVSRVRFDSLAGELAILVRRIGLSPLQAIHAATGASARILGLDARLGTLEPGRVADLIAVEGEPDRDISTLRSVRVVVRNGRVVARDGVVVDAR